MAHSDHQRISLSKSFLWIVILTFLITGGGFLLRHAYFHLRYQHHLNENYKIKYIIPKSSSKERLSHSFFLETLAISLTSPPHLYRFNTQLAEKRLLASPLIKSAAITKLHPKALRIEYTLREPIAYLGGYENTAVDSEGVLIPIKPYYKSVPSTRLFFFQGQPALKWGEKVDQALFELALKIGEIAEKRVGRYKSIDVSRAFADSLGQRQIILVKGDSAHRVILRLHPTEYQKNLDNYLLLEEELIKKGRPYPWIIDLRLPSLAYVHTGEK
jgi:hypothetical protein